jgi:hypothetical protein
MQRLRHLLDMIKFEHTIFALPFALLSLCLAADGLPHPRILFWVLVRDGRSAEQRHGDETASPTATSMPPIRVPRAATCRRAW